MVIQLILLGGLGIYAFVDYVFLTNYLVSGDLPLWPFVSAGLLAGALGVRLGKGTPVPERLGLAILLSIIAVVAAYPGVQRYTLVASPTPIAVDFNMTEPGYFEHAQYPTINLQDKNIAEYLQSLPAGQPQTFLLYESVLGFGLIDMSPVYEKTRAFYRDDER
jgi:hypothetical protein